MKTEYILTAKTINEAHSKAYELYGNDGDISIEVIEQGKKGFLGIFGVVPAKIKVIVDDGKPEKKQKQKQQRQENNNSNNSGNNGGNNGGKKPQQKQSAPNHKNDNAKPQAESNKSQGKQGSEKKSVQVAAPSVNTKPAAPMPVKNEDIEVTVQEKTLAMDFLKNFVKDAGLDCEVKGDMTVNEKGFVPRLIVIEGKDAPTLIGHRGEMLDAIQYLSNLCLARKSEGEHKEYVKVVIDIENYREKREQSLRALARRMAEKALKYQRNVLLEPMNPYERMIIHSEIQAIQGVSTHSVGYDENRKIVITVDGAPKRKPRNK